MANSGRIQYEVGFRSNTSGLAEAQKGLSNLQKTLNEIQHMRVTAITTPSSTKDEIANANQRIAEAKRVGAQIEQILQKSYNPKLNTINISTFNNELKKTTYTVESIQRAFSNIGPVGVKAFRQLTSEISKVQIKVKQTNKLLDDIKTTMVNTIRWGITSSMWNDMTGSIEKAWGFAKKLDSSLNDIRIVTGKSAEDMEKFAVQANKAAKTLGSSTTDYTNASLIYYQQGLSDAEVKARTETTLKTANVTGQSTAEVSEQLTAVWNGYKVSAKEAETYVDKLSAVAATTASDLEELSTGMSKVASAASIMGVDIDQLNAQLATIVSVTRQAPESVGTALKTIYARMGDIAAGLDSETTLGSYTKEMAAMGFNVLDANNNLKDMGKVIEEIGGKWSTLSREQQVALSQTMAGTRQYNNLLSLFDNWDMYTQALETSKNSAGTLQEQQDTFMDSTEAHLQRLTTESENLYNSLFNANTINPFLDALTNLLSLLTSFVDGIGGIVPILTTLGSVGLRVFSSQIGEGLGTSIINFKEASKNAEKLRNQFELLESFSNKTTDDIVKNQAEIGESIIKLAQKGIITQERADELQHYVDRIGELGNQITELKQKEEDYQNKAKGKDFLSRGEGEEVGLLNRLDQVIDANQKAGTDTTEIEEDAAKLENIFDRIAEKRDSLIQTQGLDLKVASPEELQNLQKENTALDEFNELIQKRFGLIKDYKGEADSSNYFTEEEAAAKKAQGGRKATTSYKKGSRTALLERTDKIDKSIQEYEKYLDYFSEEQKKDIAEMQAEYVKAFEKVKKEGSNAADEMNFIETARDFREAYDNAISEIQNQIKDLEGAATQKAEGTLEAVQAKIDERQGRANQTKDDFGGEISADGLKEKIQLITDLAGSIGSVASAISMVSDIVNVFMDEDATAEEKIKKIITLLAAAIPMMLIGFLDIKTNLISLLPAGRSAAAGLTAAGTAATASGTAATGAAAGFSALGAAMEPIGIAIAMITAAVVVFTIAAAAIEKNYNADATAAEEAAAAHERATQAVNDATTAYENLKNTINQYDTAAEKIEGLASGTEEFTEAVKEANNQAKELINTYGILSDQYYTNAKGAITFKDGVLETLEVQKEEQVALAERQATLAGLASKAATNKSDKTNTVRAIQNDTGVYGWLEGTGFEWVETVDRWIKGITSAGLSEAALHFRTTSGELGGFNEDMLDDVVSAIEDNELANGELTQAVLDSLPYTQQQKDALKENSKAIEKIVKSNKDLENAQRNSEFEKLIRQSLQTDTEFQDLGQGSQNYLVKAISNSFGSLQDFLDQNNYEEVFNSYENQSLENLGSAFAEARGAANYVVEGDGVKLVDAEGNITDYAYKAEEMARVLASEEILNTMPEVMEKFLSSAQKVSKEETDLLGKDIGLFSQFLSKGEIDLSKATSQEYNQLLGLLDEGNPALEQLFKNVDYASMGFESAAAAAEHFREKMKEVNLSDIVAKDREKAQDKITSGNEIIDKLLKGDALSEDNLKILEELQKKYSSLQGIWVTELWYKEENISKLKAVLELEEKTASSAKNVEARWRDMLIAQENFNKASEDYDKILKKNQEGSNQEGLASVELSQGSSLSNLSRDSFSNMSLEELNSWQEKNQESLKSYTSIEQSLVERLKNRDEQLLDADSQFYTDLISLSGESVNKEAIESIKVALQQKVQDWIYESEPNGASLDETLLKEDFSEATEDSMLVPLKELQEGYAEYTRLAEINEAITEEIKARNKQQEEALDEQVEKAKTYEQSVQDMLTMDLEIRISNKEDILTDVDNVIDRAQNIKTAISSIGDGFKVAADKSDELLRIFPELAEDAKVLSDGTIQLNELVVDNVLDGQGDILDSDRNKTVALLKNKITELDASIAADEAQLENVKNMSVQEFEAQSYLTDTYKDFVKEEMNVDNTQSQSEVENDGIVTKSVINNWEQKTLAAQQYAKIAAAALSDPASVAGMTIDFESYQKNVTMDAEYSTAIEDLSDEEKQKWVEERGARIKKLFEDYLQQRVDLSKQERAEYLLAISDIYSSQNDIAKATVKNIDLLKDEIDRYHDINIKLDDMAKAIDRVSKAQKHLVGKNLIVAQEQELKLLAKNIKLRKEKLKIQQEEAKELQGHLIADGVTFNDDGSVANYAQIMKEKIAEVNAAKVKAANDESYKDTADAIEKNYEEFKKNFERYEAIRDEIEDLTDEITDALYEQIDKKVAAFTAKISVKLDTAKAEKEWKEFTNKLFIPTNDALAQMQAQNDLLKSDRSIASKATSNYDKLVQQGINAQALVDGTAKEGTKSAYAIWDDLLNNGKGGYRFNEAKWKEDVDAALQEAQEATLQIPEDIQTMGSSYIDLLEQTIDAQKEQLAIYDDMNSLLNHAMKLQELFTGENDYEAKGNFYKEQQRIAREKTQSASERRQWASENIGAAQQDYLDAKAKYDAAVASGEGDTTALESYLDIAKQKYEDIKNELKDSTEDFYTSIGEQIEVAKNIYTNTINKAMADMEKKFTGNKGLSYISDEWDLINKNADRYLDTVNSTYEVQSLQAKYQKSIDSTDSLSAQKKLKKAMEEEIKLLQEKDKLSQYDIDRANKKYELTLKQIALEEAQANKSTMRLRRDAQGNYSYQFVADEDAISDAQQELLAAQNDLYNFDKERYQQTLDDALAAYQEYQQKMLEAAQINDPEERAAKEKLITEQYQQYILSITQDNEDVKKNLQESTFEALKGQYDINEQNFEAMTKGMFDDFSQMTVTDMPGCMETLVTGWNGSVQEMVDKMGNEEDGFAHEASNALGIIKTAGEELDAEIKTLGDNFSGDGGVADNILNDVKQINDDLNAFKTTVLDPTVEEGKEKLPDAWAEYKKGVSKASAALIKLSKRLGTAYDKASNLYDELQKVAKQSPIDVEVRYNQVTTGTTPSGTHDTGGGSGSSGSSSTAEEDSWIGKIITWKGEIRPYLYKQGSGEKIYFSDVQIYGKQAEDNSSVYGGKGKGTGEEYWKSKYSSVSWAIVADAKTLNKNNSEGYQVKNLTTGITGWIDKKDISKFDTGGYTGEWGSDGRMAMLHEKEIVLNKEDTANILDAVSIVRNIGSLISALNTSLVSGLSGTANIPNFGNNTVDQNVHIEASFPNVTNSSEIEDALNNLVNIASQRAFSTKR